MGNVSNVRPPTVTRIWAIERAAAGLTSTSSIDFELSTAERAEDIDLNDCHIAVIDLGSPEGVRAAQALRHPGGPVVVGLVPVGTSSSDSDISAAAGLVDVDYLAPTPVSAATIAAVRMQAFLSPPRGSMADLVPLSLLHDDQKFALRRVLAQIRVTVGATRCRLRMAKCNPYNKKLLAPRSSAEELTLLSALYGVPALQMSGGDLPTTTTGVLVSSPGGQCALLSLGMPLGHHLSRHDRDLLEGLLSRLLHEATWLARDRRAAPATTEPAHPAGMWKLEDAMRLFRMFLAGHERTGDPVAILVVGLRDIDEVTHSSETSPNALTHYFGDALLKSLRNTDAIAPLDTSTFLCFLPGADSTNAHFALRRFAARMEQSPYEDDWVVATPKFYSGVTELFIGDTAERAVLRARTAAAQALQSSDSIVVHRSGPKLEGPQAERREGGSLLASGTVLAGTYRLFNEISRGGAGVVYRAQDIQLRRPVAIKVLRTALASSTREVERFRREATTLASLRHDSLVQIYSLGEADGAVYFVMELVEGESLAERIDRERSQGASINAGEVIDIIESVAGALSTIHRAGVVHRDVKPANILYDPFQKRTVLVDVGVAWQRGGDDSIAGTPGYIAPEVLQGGGHSPLADVYGLGITAYELLALRTPWSGSAEPIQLLSQQASESCQPLTELIPELAPVAEVVQKAFASQPEDRWTSATEFAQNLRRAYEAITAPSGEWADQERTQAKPRAPMSRGILFKAGTRVLGPRRALQWSTELEEASPDLARLLSKSLEAMSWLPTQDLISLIRAVELQGRDPMTFARALGRATVRSSMRRFFPANGATLSPALVVKTMPDIWLRYHTWGVMEARAAGQSGVIAIHDTPKAPELCAMTEGMLLQLILLTGGRCPHLVTTACECRGDDSCVFELEWILSSASSKESLTSTPDTEMAES